MFSQHDSMLPTQRSCLFQKTEWRWPNVVHHPLRYVVQIVNVRPLMLNTVFY